ncbi:MULTISPECIES: fimbrial protein [Tenebrionibacter/Tenebrionicola group]|jgi:type 1 fimbria pilin|uniref:Type 1 fimbrial protein n=2 Tax=Tenebrionibacter/Tenebrionicola group TaxID=2969848 RepID=A0A8K0XW97_9ENTR|nr:MULTISPECIES: fimbrial protein [Tenebrionibacter/Tenebrionicola group]MBK4715095.1 type 1 fimbrial protein [Tenebrionibacter intestinalis]MBV5096245.1 type 1 fimbrial protein [Tenebrionicola larvae]
MRLRMMSLALVAALPLSAPVWAAGELQGGDVTFTGTVVGLPCLIQAGDEHLTVDFGTIGIRDLYSNKKTAPKQFTIHLVDCTPAISGAVTVTFSGDPNPNLPDHLAVKPNPDNVTGIGIGLQEVDGTEIKLSVPTAAKQINATTLDLTFQAYVEAEPQALANKTLTTGSFTSTANYTLNYQ